MNCLCNLLDDSTLWIIVIALVLLHCFCSSCGNGCGSNSGCGCGNNSGCGCGC